MEITEKQKLGRSSRKAGKIFENKVKHDLETKGWIVARWTKKIEEGILVDNKPRFNPFTRRLESLQTGFPDFICLAKIPILVEGSQAEYYKIKLVESKMRGFLDGAEREQVKYLKLLGFEIEIASKNGNEIQYKQAVGNP